MREMVSGANIDLAAPGDGAHAVVVSLRWSSPAGDGDADVSVLLLGADGKVRSDADFFFYNNPTAADGSVQLLGKIPAEEGDEDRITLDLAAIPGDVDRIAVTASRYEGAASGSRLHWRTWPTPRAAGTCSTAGSTSATAA
ncbi:TerD family protein, partial [Streptomyces sp. NPDC058423]|uniref:TerD family protein n=1 Tax=unclassified Streptomyces TaxID=2593676 RepID=UPI003664C1CF